MPRHAVSRGRGPRITQQELEKMVELYLQGRTFKAIAQAVGRHWQTVRKYTVRALREREGEQLRREALKAALIEHFDDLVRALGAISQLLDMPDWTTRPVPGAWQPAAPPRRDYLLLQALKEAHAKDSPLWALWDNWNQTRRAYDNELPHLNAKVDRELKAIEQSSVGASLREQLNEVLVRRAVSIAMDGSLYEPSMLTVRPALNGEGKEETQELWLGESTLLATGRDMDGFRQALSELMLDMKQWDETKELARLYRRLIELKTSIEEEVEVLSLRRAFPGRCRLCPV